MILEVFSCSGGLAEGLRRAGLAPDMAFDFDSEACASYEANLGHRPVQLDARDLLRMARAGWSPGLIDLLVADPPCTPWSRAGKRLGTDDERDMLEVTVHLIRVLRPLRYLIANVPGLDDGPNWPVVQRTIGGLAKDGYCVVDFRRLDAADYGVPQHRVRPFWYGHRVGPCVVWPAPTHADPDLLARGTELVDARAAWVTCRQALGHLPPSQLCRPVRLRWRGCTGSQIASVPDRPARVVGTSSLSDGNVLAHPSQAVRPRRASRNGSKPRASDFDAPSRTITTRDAREGSTLFDALAHPGNAARKAHVPSRRPRATHLDECAQVVRAGDAPTVFDGPNHRPSSINAPARTLTGNTHGDGALLAYDGHPISRADEPALSVPASQPGNGGAVLAWPWDRPSTALQTDDRIPPPGHHDEYATRSMPNAVKLSETAAAILQGFPAGWVFAGATKRARWSMIGQAMPPPLAEAVGRSIARAMRRTEAAT